MQRVDRDLERRIREQYGVDGPIAPVTVCPPKTCAIDESAQFSWAHRSKGWFREAKRKKRIAAAEERKDRVDYSAQAQEEARERLRAERRARMLKARANLDVALAARLEKSKWRKETLRELAALGMYADEIARRIGVRTETVYTYAAELGVKIDHKPKTEGPRKNREKAAARLARHAPELRRMHAAGMSQPKMSAATGIPPTTLWKMLKRLGLVGGCND